MGPGAAGRSLASGLHPPPCLPGTMPHLACWAPWLLTSRLPTCCSWPDTETPCLLLVDVFSGSLVSGVASSEKPSALGGHPAKHSCGNCECFCQGRHHIVCAFLCSAAPHRVLTSANHVSQAPSLVMASVRSHQWEAMAGGWRTRRDEAGVFLTLFWWSLWQGLPFLRGLGPRWLTLVPGCC